MPNGFQPSNWNLILQNINGLSSVNLSGNASGLAPEDAIVIAEADTASVEMDIGAGGDALIRNNMQSFKRVLTVKTIKGGLADQTFFNACIAQNKAVLAQTEIPTFTVIASQTVTDGNNNFITTGYEMQYSSMENTQPGETIRHANADKVQLIREYKIIGAFYDNQQY